MHKIREEEERRKETQAKFQSTLAEISTLLQQNNEKNAKLRDDNISMTEKFKSVVQQYQIREDQVWPASYVTFDPSPETLHLGLTSYLWVTRHTRHFYA